MYFCRWSRWCCVFRLDGTDLTKKKKKCQREGEKTNTMENAVLMIRNMCTCVFVEIHRCRLFFVCFLLVLNNVALNIVLLNYCEWVIMCWSIGFNETFVSVCNSIFIWILLYDVINQNKLWNGYDFFFLSPFNFTYSSCNLLISECNYIKLIRNRKNGFAEF